MLTLEDIQKDYPENLTLAMEKKLPGYTRGDEWFGFRMMNGMNKASFMPDKDKKGIYHVKFFGAGDYEHNNEYAFPDTDIEFEIHKDKTPLPVAITFTGPLNALNKDPFQTRTFTRNDGEDWLAAKRLARVCGAVCAEVDEHYTGTHVNTEQFAIAAFRNFRKNPVTWILFPHLKEVSLINAGADKTIIGGYLPTATALTTKGLVNRCRDILGVHNWKGWQPMEVINETHTYAKAENLFWNLLGDFMDFFFEKYEKDIKTFWNEVYFFSEDLVNHSVPVFLSELHVEKMNASKKERYERLKEYTHFQFGYHPEHSAEIVHGKSVAMSSITKSKTFTRDEDFNNLKDACRYAIMMATFSHTWINEHQYDDLGEILYSCGGLRFGEKESGVIGPESDPHIAPDLTRSTQMLWFTNFLSRTEYGFITRNEENDIHPYFIELLLKHKDEFMELGVDIESIESRTNI